MTAEPRIRDILAVLFGEEAQAALSASEVASHARDLLEAAGAGPEILERSLSERTVRYYQAQGIVTPPTGNTTNARYGLRQVLESAAARMAGSVRHLSLAEAAEEVAARDESGLIAMIADLLAKQPRAAQRPRPLYVAEAVNKVVGRKAGGGADDAFGEAWKGQPGPEAQDADAPESNAPGPEAPESKARDPEAPESRAPGPEAPGSSASAATPAWMIDLGGGAILMLPADHPLLRSSGEIDEVRRRILDAMTD